MSPIFTFKMDYYAIWAIFLFLQVSEKVIWEAHYSQMAWHLRMEKYVVIL
jgi:hypothetical protein